MTMKVIRRDDVTFELTFKDSDEAVIDLTTGTVFFTVKTNLTDADADAILAKEIDTFETPETGIMLLNLSRTETDIEPGSYYFDIQLKLDDKVTSSERGKFKVVQDITVRTS